MLVVVFNFVLAILLVADDLDGINCLPKMAHKFLSPGGKLSNLHEILQW